MESGRDCIAVSAGSVTITPWSGCAGRTMDSSRRSESHSAWAPSPVMYSPDVSR